MNWKVRAIYYSVVFLSLIYPTFSALDNKEYTAFWVLLGAMILALVLLIEEITTN